MIIINFSGHPLSEASLQILADQGHLDTVSIPWKADFNLPISEQVFTALKDVIKPNVHYGLIMPGMSNASVYAVLYTYKVSGIWPSLIEMTPGPDKSFVPSKVVDLDVLAADLRDFR